MNDNGWTQTPNHILNNMADMKPAVFKVCMAVVRKTYGFRENGKPKKWDRISTSQFMELTGLSNRAVIDAIGKAIEDGYINRRAISQWFEYSVADPQTYENSSQPSSENSSWVDEKGYEVSSQITETYENTSQDVYEKSSQDEPTCENSSREPMKKVHTQKKKEITTNTFPNGKVSTPNGVTPPTSPSALLEGKKSTKPKKSKPPSEYVNPSTGVGTVEIKAAYMTALDNAEPGAVVNHGEAGKAAKSLAQAGWKPQDVTTAFWKLKHDKFWKEKHLPLTSVASQIAALLNGKVAVNGHVNGDSQRKRMKQL